MLIGANVLAMVGSATPAEQRPALLPVGGVLTAIGRAAIGLLIVTGPLMLWLKWGGHTPSDAWFGIKMLFVVILIVGIIMSSIGLKRHDARQRGGRGAGAAGPADRQRRAGHRGAGCGFHVRLSGW